MPQKFNKMNNKKLTKKLTKKQQDFYESIDKMDEIVLDIFLENDIFDSPSMTFYEEKEEDEFDEYGNEYCNEYDNEYGNEYGNDYGEDYYCEFSDYENIYCNCDFISLEYCSCSEDENQKEWEVIRYKKKTKDDVNYESI